MVDGQSGTGTGTVDPSGGGQAPPPGVGPGAGTGAVSPGTGDWTSAIEDAELRGWVQSRGWKTPADALASHRELESLRGVPAGQLIRLPQSAEDADGWREVHRRLGAPETPDKYELPTADVPEGQIDLSGDLRTWAHELGLTQSQAAGIYERFGARMGELQAAESQQREERTTADLNELKTSWGQEYDANVVSAKRAAQHLGMQESELSAIEDAMGPRRTMELFAQIGNGLSELATGRDEVTSGTPFGMTPEAARAQLSELQRDTAFMERSLSPGSPEHARRQRLARIAYPD